MKKGFSLIETIITVVVLTTSLLLLYNSYSNILGGERTKMYYDDVSDLYKTAYIKQFLEANMSLVKIKNEAFTDSYSVVIGPNYEDICANELSCTTLTNLYNNFNINQIVLIKKDYFSCDDYKTGICGASISNISVFLQNYIRSLNSYDYDYFIVVEYSKKYDSNSKKFNRCLPRMENDCISSYAALEI